MPSATRLVIMVLLASALADTAPVVEDESPAKIAKMLLLPKKYKPIPMGPYREITTEVSETVTSTSTTSELSTTPNPETDIEVLSDQVNSSRPRKSAPICIEVLPKNPYQTPFQVCEPGYPTQYEPDLPPQMQFQPQSAYAAAQPQPAYAPAHVQPQPAYAPAHVQPQPAYAPAYPQPQPAYAPAQKGVPAPSKPYMPAKHHMKAPAIQQPSLYLLEPVVLPHVPVAEPYHVQNGGYKSNLNEIPYEQKGPVRPSAHYRHSFGDYYDKTPLYDYQHQKEISYLPIITKTVKTSKPLKMGKLLKELKKGKYYDDDYLPAGGYGNFGGPVDPHGLVITCQPSAAAAAPQHLAGPSYDLPLALKEFEMYQFMKNYDTPHINSYSGMHTSLQGLVPGLLPHAPLPGLTPGLSAHASFPGLMPGVPAHGLASGGYNMLTPRGYNTPGLIPGGYNTPGLGINPHVPIPGAVSGGISEGYVPHSTYRMTAPWDAYGPETVGKDLPGDVYPNEGSNQMQEKEAEVLKQQTPWQELQQEKQLQLQSKEQQLQSSQQQLQSMQPQTITQQLQSSQQNRQQEEP